MSDDIPTSRVYATSPVFDRHEAGPSDLGQMLEALTHASDATRSQFAQAIRDYALAEFAADGPFERPERKPFTVPPPPTPGPSELVYYLLFGDRVKIGYTTNLKRRLTAIPHDEVLATEPGTMKDEKARHIKFSDLRVTGEWFRYEEPLISHIAALPH